MLLSLRVLYQRDKILKHLESVGLTFGRVRMVEISAVEQNIEKRMKRNEDSLGDLWGNIKCPNIHIVGSQKEKERT